MKESRLHSNTLKIAFVLSFILIVFYSCKKGQFRAETPSYLHISSIDLQADLSQGSRSHKISDAWVTMDGQFLGVFQLPATVPILADGKHEFSIYAGISANGIAATRIRYPFYEVCDLWTEDDSLYEDNLTEIYMYRDSVISVKATTRYSDQTQFLLTEDFEGTSLDIEPSDISDTSIVDVSSPDLIYEGRKSGAVYIDSTNPFFEIISSDFQTLQSIYNSNMLELDYRCDHPFRVGVAVKSGSVIRRFEKMQVNASEEWNKIYIHLTHEINEGNSSDEFGIYIGALKLGSKETAAFYFDNIKWLHKKQ